MNRRFPRARAVPLANRGHLQESGDESPHSKRRTIPLRLYAEAVDRDCETGRLGAMLAEDGDLKGVRAGGGELLPKHADTP
jgi:hypothetical protein